MKLGVLASHAGSTLQCVIDACETGQLNAEITVVISNNSNSGALQRANRHEIAAFHISSATHPGTAEDEAICDALLQHHVDWVLLLGYMKKLGPQTLETFSNRVTNTHPALLPKYGGQGFYGRRVHEAVYKNKDAVTGATIHLVDHIYDNGKVLAQREVAVAAADTVDDIENNVKNAERNLLIDTLIELSQSNSIHQP